MQIANAMLSLSGDSGNTVPKFGVTPAEVAVLQAIHGNDAVQDIEPIGAVQRTHRAERQRLIEKYGRQIEGQFSAKVVEQLFPGVAARVYENFDELEIPEEFFKAETRVKAPAAPEEKPAKAGRKGAKQADVQAEIENDGVEDMPDAAGAFA